MVASHFFSSLLGDTGSFADGWSLLIETSGGDYVAKSGTLTFPAGSTSQTLSVSVNGDTILESTETFKLTLSGASAANITDAEGLGTIRNDEFTDASLSGVFIKTVHITELRTLINDVRVAKGLEGFSWTDPTLTVGSTSVRAVHIQELRTALNGAYTAASQTLPTYTDPSLNVGVTVIKAVHITELRSAVSALE